MCCPYFGDLCQSYYIIFTVVVIVGNATFTTKGWDLFDRTFKPDQYFYCKGCKKFEFQNDSDAACVDDKCSYVTIENSKIYPGDIDEDDPDSK